MRIEPPFLLIRTISWQVIRKYYFVLHSQTVAKHTHTHTHKQNHRYEITARVGNEQLAQCVSEASLNLEIVETKVENLALERSGYWSSICGEERPYSVSWNISDSVLLDIDLCRISDGVCRNLERGSCTYSFVATYENFWNLHQDFLQSSTSFHIRVGLSSKEDQCVSPGIAVLNVTSSRDDTFCPVPDGSSSSGLTDAEMTGLIIPIIVVAFLLILCVYCYYKRRMTQTVKKAKDLMEAQEVRHEQETKMEQLELPSTRSQLVFDLPVDSLDSSSDSEKERLRRENAALSKELKKRKYSIERNELKSSHGNVNIKSQRKESHGFGEREL